MLAAPAFAARLSRLRLSTYARSNEWPRRCSNWTGFYIGGGHGGYGWGTGAGVSTSRLHRRRAAGLQRYQVSSGLVLGVGSDNFVS